MRKREKTKIACTKKLITWWYDIRCLRLNIQIEVTNTSYHVEQKIFKSETQGQRHKTKIEGLSHMRSIRERTTTACTKNLITEVLS
jgi:hypothetical protein